MQQSRTYSSTIVKKFVIVAMIFIVGCVRHPIPQNQPISPGPEYLAHKITFPGETLGIISLWYTSDSGLWRNFYIPATSGTVRKLKRGDEILIPIEFVVRQEPITKEFIRANRPKVSTNNSRVEPNKSIPTKPADSKEMTILEAVPDELTPLEIEPFEERPNSPVELEKEFIDRIVR